MSYASNAGTEAGIVGAPNATNGINAGVRTLPVARGALVIRAPAVGALIATIH